MSTAQWTRDATLEELHRSLELALNHELPQLRRVRTRLAPIRRIPIAGPRDETALKIATVAADGGDNRLQFEPIRIQIIRVADSSGTRYFDACIPLSLAPEEILRFFVSGNDLLQWFVRELEIEWADLLPTADHQKPAFLSTLRELVEWASILRLVASPSTPPTLVIRDGLLRSISLRVPVFTALRQRLEHHAALTGNLLAGVAKRSVVLNYLSLAINLDEVLPDGEAAYVEIPAELEAEASPPNYRWQAPRSMGQLLLARLANNARLVVPVELPRWQEQAVPVVMQSLSHDACGGFPVGYPMSLYEAHRHATIGGMDMEIIRKVFLAELRKQMPEFSSGVAYEALLGQPARLQLGVIDNDD